MGPVHEVGEIPVEPSRRAAVALDAITSARSSWAREHRRPKALTAREALAALQFETLLVWVAANNIACGVELKPEDLERLNIACKRIDAIASEAA